VRALVQRVVEAAVEVDGQTVGEIGSGLLVLVGVTHDDAPETADRLAEKVWNLRIMPAEVAEPLVERFTEALRALGATVATGRFGAHMHVRLVNDGPVTVSLEL